MKCPFKLHTRSVARRGWPQSNARTEELLAIPVRVPPIQQQRRLSRVSAVVVSGREAQLTLGKDLEELVPALCASPATSFGTHERSQHHHDEPIGVQEVRGTHGAADGSLPIWRHGEPPPLGRRATPSR